MQHAGLQYGQGAANSHQQSPPFAHADISQTSGGNTTSSLRQFRKKDSITDKPTGTDEINNIARVPPHNHYPARPNDYYLYHQYPDYSATNSQVKFSEISETPQHVDQKHIKEPPMNMCNISQPTLMNKNYPENLSRQQSYPADNTAAPHHHHQYMQKEPQQIHQVYKQESQPQQYQQQYQKYNMPSVAPNQLRKYPLPPPTENDFLTKLQRLNPSIARSIMSEHHIRESQSAYNPLDQNRMWNHQRYYPVQNNSYNYMGQGYNYQSCNYRQPTNQISSGARYNPERSLSPRRNLNYSENIINYGTPQKIAPNYTPYNAPEYAQHYQHRRAAMAQDYYQQTYQTSGYITGHQISPEVPENRTSSGLRQFLENWAEEEVVSALHNEGAPVEPVIVINSSDIPQGIENVSLVSSDNVQYIIKASNLENSVVRIKETSVENGERTVNLQIVENSDQLNEIPSIIDELTEAVPCDSETKVEKPVKIPDKVEAESEIIKDMPLIEEKSVADEEKIEETVKTAPSRRIQRIFSVDDIMNKIGPPTPQPRRSSLQLTNDFAIDSETKSDEVQVDEEVEYRSAICVEDDVIIEIGGALVQLNLNVLNGAKVLSVVPLSEPLIIDVNAHQQIDEEEAPEDCYQSEVVIGDDSIDLEETEESVSLGVEEKVLPSSSQEVEEGEVEMPKMDSDNNIEVLSEEESLKQIDDNIQELVEEVSSSVNTVEENALSKEEESLNAVTTENKPVDEEILNSIKEEENNSEQVEEISKTGEAVVEEAVSSKEENLMVLEKGIDKAAEVSKDAKGHSNQFSEEEIFKDSQKVVEEDVSSKESLKVLKIDKGAELRKNSKRHSNKLVEEISKPDEDILKDSLKVVAEAVSSKEETLKVSQKGIDKAAEVRKNSKRHHNKLAEEISKTTEDILKDSDKVVEEAVPQKGIDKAAEVRKNSKRHHNKLAEEISKTTEDILKDSDKVVEEAVPQIDKAAEVRKNSKRHHNKLAEEISKTTEDILKDSDKAVEEALPQKGINKAAEVRKISKRHSIKLVDEITKIDEEILKDSVKVVEEAVSSKEERLKVPQKGIDKAAEVRKNSKRHPNKLAEEISKSYEEIEEDKSLRAVKKRFDKIVEREPEARKNPKRHSNKLEEEISNIVEERDPGKEDESLKTLKKGINNKVGGREPELRRNSKRHSGKPLVDDKMVVEEDAKKGINKIDGESDSRKNSKRHSNKPTEYGDNFVKEKIPSEKVISKVAEREPEARKNFKRNANKPTEDILVIEKAVKTGINKTVEVSKNCSREDEDALKVAKYPQIRKYSKKISNKTVEVSSNFETTKKIELYKTDEESPKKTNSPRKSFNKIPEKEIAEKQEPAKRPTRRMSTTNEPDTSRNKQPRRRYSTIEGTEFYADTVIEEKPKSASEILKKRRTSAVGFAEEFNGTVTTKAAKKLYSEDTPKVARSDPRLKPVSKLEEAVNKMKKRQDAQLENNNNHNTNNNNNKKNLKRVTFNLNNCDPRLSNKSLCEDDKKKLSWQEYNSRKRKVDPDDGVNKNISEDTVTSSNDFDDKFIEQVELSIENDIIQGSTPEPIMRKPSPRRVIDNNWEDEIETPHEKKTDYERTKQEYYPQMNSGKPALNKFIIDVNEFNIKPIESLDSPSTVSSSSHFSYSQENDLQQYQQAVDSKLSSLNFTIPYSKPKPTLRQSEKMSVDLIIEKFLNKSVLNDNELAKVKKIIEFKRKIEEDLSKKHLTYEVRDRRDFNDRDLKMHFRKIETSSPKRKRKQRFRNLYTDETSSGEESDRSQKNVVADYSVFQQRDCQGVPKLIFKRNPGLPQPFVKLERSQAAELMAKKRKLY